MKRTAIFVTLCTFFPVALMGAAGSAMVDDFSGQAIGQKGSVTFSLAFDLVRGATNGLISDQNLSTFMHFEEICGDKDSVDMAEWRNESVGNLTLIFNCLDDSAAESLNHGSSFTFVFDSSTRALVSAQEFEFIREKSSSSRTRITIMETTAVLGSSFAAAATAARIFPGETDKKLHSGLSASMAAALTSVAYHYYGFSKNQAAFIGGSSSCLIGGAKEIVDPYVGGHRSGADFKADLIGCALGAIGMRLAIEFN
jgi:hypothetical protein